jgi:Pentapeptide repeats (8 copies)
MARRARPPAPRPAWARRRSPAPTRPKRNWTSSSAIVNAAVSGIAVIVAALIAAFIAFLASSQAQRAASVQLKIAEQGQFTDRYTAAITNLGSRSVEVRLGGIYALQRLMQDSPRDQPTVVAVLGAFVRDQTALTATTPGSQASRAPTDVQAALTVVGTRNTANDGRATVVDFDLAQLANTRLLRLQFSGADFSGANLTGAALNGANLTRALLGSANLTRAGLVGADLVGAYLAEADLSGAYLFRADLSGADLRAGLAPANFSGANLTGAKWSKNFPAPEGWVRDPGTGQLTRANAGS